MILIWLEKPLSGRLLGEHMPAGPKRDKEGLGLRLGGTCLSEVVGDIIHLCLERIRLVSEVVSWIRMGRWSDKRTSKFKHEVDAGLVCGFKSFRKCHLG